MIQLHVNHDPNFAVSSRDQMDIYELYIVLKRRGRLEIERLSRDLKINRRIRDVAILVDTERNIVNRRTRKPEDYGLR